MVRRDPFSTAMIKVWCARLRQRRLDRGITLAEMEKRLGFTRLMIRQWEHALHIPRLEALMVWAEQLDFALELTDVQIIDDGEEDNEPDWSDPLG